MLPVAGPAVTGTLPVPGPPAPAEQPAAPSATARASAGASRMRLRSIPIFDPLTITRSPGFPWAVDAGTKVLAVPARLRPSCLPSSRSQPVIELTFIPIIPIGDWNVRLETIGLAAVVLACLVVAALIGRKTLVNPVWTARDAAPDATPARDTGAAPDAAPAPDRPDHLRADDLLYIAVSALPGAVVGGRLGYALLHLDYYGANPSALLDISQGGLELSLGVVGGIDHLGDRGGAPRERPSDAGCTRWSSRCCSRSPAERPR